MSRYCDSSTRRGSYQIPLSGSIDLSYRCNNACRHCWICLPPNSEQRAQELTFDEIRGIVDQAKAMGCRNWAISGGEPMLNKDFADVFDYIMSRSMTYTLNTNGTLITPAIARLMRREGAKMVALYGATADVHDHVTRNPGSYEATIRGMRYLNEAGAKFIVQVIPLADNEHQFQAMCSLAESLGTDWRVGLSWLRFTACRDETRNDEIQRQRISPRRMLEIDAPRMSNRTQADWAALHCEYDEQDDRLLASCMKSEKFHVDPYGEMSFCEYIRDPALRFDLRSRSFEDCWNEFTPCLTDRFAGDEEYSSNCQHCAKRSICYWCPAAAYLEHGRYSAKVDYLCGLATETDEQKKDWSRKHCRHFSLAGITICIESDLEIDDTTFHTKFKPFEISDPGTSDVIIHHRFELPRNMGDLGEEVFKNPLYAISTKDGAWIYRKPGDASEPPEQVSVFNSNYTRATIYNASADRYRDGGLAALSMLVVDQVMLSHTLAHFGACFFHCCAANVNGAGFLFLGHSGAGKSTMAAMLRDRCVVLGEEHLVVRDWPDGLWIHGSWSHNGIKNTSAENAPLKAVCLLDKAPENRAELLEDSSVVIEKLIGCMIRPLQTKEWWELNFPLLNKIASDTPCYNLRFDKSGRIFDVIQELSEQLEGQDAILRR